MRTFALLVALVCLLVIAPRAHASGTKPSVFAIVVTNNRSVRLGRPDLRYADDDGAKYYDVLRMIAPEPNVALLTAFDRDTARLFPRVAGKERPPTKVELLATARTMAEKMRAAAGPTELYFVFAGHGDVDRGKGFLELADGPFTSDDLESLLKAMPATRVHVILDSCNSFFVINARKPGGRHFVTSAEATLSLSERLPNVGVFLSTSAEAEVYEWSELQSGVFSHAVRSGLSGAADVDRDGRISYDELRAFVNLSSAEIKNPNYRPHVFARAPGGRGSEPLFELAGARATRIRIDEGAHRLTVRDANELRALDLHKEAGSPLSVWLPPAAAKDASIEELDGPSGVALRRRRLEPNDEGEAILASLPPAERPSDARGPDDVFRALFARPFGPASFARYEDERAREEPAVFGISSDDPRRMSDLLEQAADQAKTRRLAAALTASALGVVMVGGGAYGYAQSETSSQRSLSLTLTFAGGAALATGLIGALITSKEEDIFEAYARDIKREKDPLKVVARSERELFALAEDYRRHRMLMRVLGLGLGGLVLGIGVASVVRAEDATSRLGNGLLFGALFTEMAFIVGWSFVKYPTEETAALWAKDPSLERLRSSPRAKVRVTPGFGLGTLGVSGTF